MNDLRNSPRVRAILLVASIVVPAWVAGCGSSSGGNKTGDGGSTPGVDSAGTVTGDGAVKPQTDGGGTQPQPDGGSAGQPDVKTFIPKDGPPTEFEKVCIDLNTAICNKLAMCDPLTVKKAFGDAKTCAERLAISCEGAMKAEGSGLTAAAAMSCAQAYTAASCDADPNTIAACTFKGSKANAATCQSGDQCQTGHCALPANASCGTCGPTNAAGGTCVENDDCNAGLYCNDNGTCVAPAAAGMPCSDALLCNVGLYCEPTKSTCAPLVTTMGGACASADACDVNKGLLCHPMSKTCQPLKFATAGQACGLLGADLVDCQAGSECLGMQGATQGTCSAVAKDGQACTDAIGCLSPAECIGGTCRFAAGTPVMCN